ncbi:alanine racemase [Qipengyuania sediminis]|uniref:alanine racemase n=1 Tax=Qipengyuania sediminis TaxID=1532023 RepID=UPI00105A4911|nr:alanine racemase [Qipengyuania sediminis]
MIPPPPPTLRLRLDTGALAHNWRALDAMSRPGRAGAAIKADCYGLGLDRCVPVLRDAGARDFFVAHWQEVMPALRHLAPEQIAVLHGPITAGEAGYARATGVRPVINSLLQARLWTQSGGGPCHLMVDTGINRLGLRPEELGDSAIAELEIDTLISHLACADEPGSAMTARQLAAFRAVCALLPHRRASLANSAGIASGAEFAFDLTRPGLALYGGVPHPALAGNIRQVAQPEAALIAVRKLAAGETVGYNATFTASREMRVGIVSMGYADGILRSWRGGAFRAQGCALPMLGTISMDMIVIDLTAAPELVEGDWAELPYDLPHASAHTGLSQYELLTTLGRRFG